MRWSLRIASVLLALMLLAWAILHWIIVPRIDDFRPRVQALAAQAIGAPVTIGALRAESNGLVPSVALHEVRVHDPTGRAGLTVPRLLASFSVLSLLRGNLEQLVVERPQLELRRTADGRLLLGGIDLSGNSSGSTDAADWFFSQDEFLVLGGQVRWVDESRAVAPVTLRDVQLVVRNGQLRHQLRLDATPDVAWGQRFTVMGRFRQPLLSLHAGAWKQWSGQIYADLARIDVSRLRQYVDLKTDWGVDLRQGQGAARVWLDVRKGKAVGATADVALGAVEATFGPTLKPLAFASLTGRVGWKDDGRGLEVSTRGLQFVDADGLTWPGGNFQLSYRGQQGADAGGGTLSGNKLDLAALAKIASRLPLPRAVHERLRAHAVHGLVETLEARWEGALDAPKDWRVQTRVSGLSLGAVPAAPRANGEPVAGVPGVEGASVALTATPAGGDASIDIRNGALAFPGVFEEPRIALAQLSAQTRWRQQGERIEVQVDDLRIVNADANATFKARWHTGDPKAERAARFPGVLDLEGVISRANGARVHRYLPLAIPADGRHYVRDAIVKGDARDFQVRVKGDLRYVGDNHPPPGTELQFAGRVNGVTMAYVPRALQPAGQPPWPPLQELAGELVFNHNSMQVKDARGGVQGHPGWQFSGVNVGIADMANTRVVVSADGRGPLTAALGIVRASPVADFTHHALDDAQASGNASLQLQLDLPIDHMDKAKVAGSVTLGGNDVRITADTPQLSQARGSVRFSDTGFAITDVRAAMLGGEVRVSGGLAESASHVTVRASGIATAEGLRQAANWAPLPAIAQHASGSTPYEAVITFEGAQPSVRVSSDLRGMAFSLPAPLTKPGDAGWPLRFEAGPAPRDGADASARNQLRLTLADVLALTYESEPVAGASNRVTRGALALGPQAVAALALPASGVSAQVQLARLEVSDWQALLPTLFGSQGGAMSSGGYLPDRWLLKTDELALDERSLHEVTTSGTREGNTWRADVQARELAGRIEYSEGQAGRAGKVHARLARLSVPKDNAADAPAALTEPPEHIPALDVVVEDFELRGKKLGRLEVEAVNHDAAPSRQGAAGVQEWTLSRLLLKSPEATLSATGRWATQPRARALPIDPRAPRAPGEARGTALDFKLDIADAGALLTRFDMPGVLARGKGQLHGQISWAGTPLSPHYPSMDGQLHLDMGAGQFLKADPGIAKLLGVISLQALPRRLTLDFRDLFSTGFAFDFVRGDVALARGVARTNNLQMKGVNAAVLIDGIADIDKETQNLQVVVVPEIDAGTAALAATVINPALGIGAFIAQLVLKRPLIKAATREFHIGGTWDDPQVTPINARAESAAAAASAPEPATAKENP